MTERDYKYLTCLLALLALALLVTMIALFSSVYMRFMVWPNACIHTAS
jgi:hypothetical protein